MWTFLCHLQANEMELTNVVTLLSWKKNKTGITFLKEVLLPGLEVLPSKLKITIYYILTYIARSFTFKYPMMLGFSERASLFFLRILYYCNCTTSGRMEKYFGWPFLFIYWTFVLLLAWDTIDGFQAERHFICLDRFLVKAKKIIISF